MGVPGAEGGGAEARRGGGYRAAGAYALVDSTLREGEQFESGDFSGDDKVAIARLLDAFGVDYLELTSPAASPRARADCERIAGLGLGCRLIAHIRCHEEDARVALGSGVGAISMVLGASPILRAASHGLALDEVVRRAIAVAEAIRRAAPAIELRFSTEDAFRCPREDLLAISRPLLASGLFDRFGLADTTGAATPLDVFAAVGRLAAETDLDIEFHGHNDTGCAVANALTALEAGASHVDVTVLGIGERNGIAALEGVIAGLYARDPAGTAARYRLPLLPQLVALVAERVGIEIPFNHCIVGRTAFTHKAGIHTKAVINDPHSYELIDPEAFGRQRAVLVAHRLTGRHAIGVRARELGLALDAESLAAVTRRIKAAADERALSLAELDAMLRAAAARRAIA
ncbi:MAG: homocitrate synthase [Dongiaceae bacterium]